MRGRARCRNRTVVEQDEEAETEGKANAGVEVADRQGEVPGTLVRGIRTQRTKAAVTMGWGT